MNTTTAENLTTEKKPRDLIAQGVHILKSYLSAVGISFASGSLPGEVIVTAKNGESVTALVGDVNTVARPGIIVISPDSITSYNFDTALLAFWSVTEAAGYGNPLPIDRGEKPGERVSYLNGDGFELVYLRHTLFRRSPNRTAEELAPYMPTVKSAARRAAFHFNSVFGAMGFDADDLTNVGLVYTISFLHNYAVSENLTDQIKLLTAYLNQRFGEFAKICYKKALNATSLPTMVKTGPISVSSDGEAVDYIETYAEANGPSADEEYEAGEYTVRIKTDTGHIEAQLKFQPSKMLGVDLYLNGSLLPKTQADAFREGINSGRIQIVPTTPPPSTEEAPQGSEESALDKRLKARAELHAKLNAMTPEQRETALAYASFSRDYDPDARRMARTLSEELACPKCLKRVPSGAICLTCEVEARPRYGVNYEAFREKLRAEGHTMADAMTAPIPESESRSRQRRAKVSDTTPILDAGPNKDAPKVAPSSQIMSKEEIKALSKKLAADFMAGQPPTRQCVNCKKHLPKEDFGVRVPRNKETGVPERAVWQSWCKPCRKVK